MVEEKTASEPERDIEMEELREEITRLKEAVAGRIEEAKEAFSERATFVRENPKTFTAALMVGGLVGLLVGIGIGRSRDRHGKW